jgi:glutathione synthetase
LFGRLAVAILANRYWLTDVLEPVARVDPFVKFLLSLRRPHNAVLGIFRSDYMYDEPSRRVLQVEWNTMSCAFASLSTVVANLHSGGHSHQGTEGDEGRSGTLLHNMTGAILQAHEHQTESHELDRPAVLMVVRPDECNVHDQGMIVNQLADDGVLCLRRTLREIHAEAVLDPSGTLTISDDVGGKVSVSVVYYRAAYDWSEFHESESRDARTLLESCNAIPCPSAELQLIGSKKVQQVLSEEEVLEKFVCDHDACMLREVFARQWAGNSIPSDVSSELVADPSRFILKPQTEGGGHNLHGADIVSTLTRDASERVKYILMEKIRPPTHPTVVLRGGMRENVTSAVGELGVFSTVLVSNGNILFNRPMGTLLRVKDSEEKEGGVACGASALSSVSPG